MCLHACTSQISPALLWYWSFSLCKLSICVWAARAPTAGLSCFKILWLILLSEGTHERVSSGAILTLYGPIISTSQCLCSEEPSIIRVCFCHHDVWPALVDPWPLWLSGIGNSVKRVEMGYTWTEGFNFKKQLWHTAQDSFFVTFHLHLSISPHIPCLFLWHIISTLAVYLHFLLKYTCDGKNKCSILK